MKKAIKLVGNYFLWLYAVTMILWFVLIPFGVTTQSLLTAAAFGVAVFTLLDVFDYHL
jgi:bacteriorhodopsin